MFVPAFRSRDSNYVKNKHFNYNENIQKHLSITPRFKAICCAF